MTDDFRLLLGDGSFFLEGDGGGRTLIVGVGGGGTLPVNMGDRMDLVVEPARLPNEDMPAVKREEYDLEGAMELEVKKGIVVIVTDWVMNGWKRQRLFQCEPHLGLRHVHLLTRPAPLWLSSCATSFPR